MWFSSIERWVNKNKISESICKYKNFHKEMKKNLNLTSQFQPTVPYFLKKPTEHILPILHIFRSSQTLDQTKIIRYDTQTDKLQLIFKVPTTNFLTRARQEEASTFE
jgi:hypothetical protein